MSNTEICQLTTKDHSLLEVMLERHAGRDDAMTRLLRRKISHARVTFAEDIPSTVVTLNSRVAYRVDGGPAETRIVAHNEMLGPVGMILAITNPRGLALLGLAEGQSTTIANGDAGAETLTVQSVVYQPEAARQEIGNPGRRSARSFQSPRGSFLRVVHCADSAAGQPTRKNLMAGESSLDNPDPSAA